MKIQGKDKVSNLVETVVLKKGGEEFIFKAQPVNDYDAFHLLCPTPEPPSITYPNGEKGQDVSDEGYIKKIDDYASYRTHWMVLESLKATDDLEWSTVKENEPESWKNYGDELQAFGFSQLEVSNLINIVTDACGLNQKKINDATESFLARQVAKASESAKNTGR